MVRHYTTPSNSCQRPFAPGEMEWITEGFGPSFPPEKTLIVVGGSYRLEDVIRMACQIGTGKPSQTGTFMALSPELLSGKPRHYHPRFHRHQAIVSVGNSSRHGTFRTGLP